MNVLNEYKDIQVNLVGSVKDYRDKLQEKYMFFLNVQVEVITNNQLALKEQRTRSKNGNNHRKHDYYCSSKHPTQNDFLSYRFN
jgi:hypothetical protein